MSWNEKLNALQIPELPEPINHTACEKCPYNIICCSYLRYMFIFYTILVLLKTQFSQI